GHIGRATIRAIATCVGGHDARAVLAMLADIRELREAHLVVVSVLGSAARLSACACAACACAACACAACACACACACAACSRTSSTHSPGGAPIRLVGRSHAGLPTAGRNRQDHPEEAAHLLND